MQNTFNLSVLLDLILPKSCFDFCTRQALLHSKKGAPRARSCRPTCFCSSRLNCHNRMLPLLLNILVNVSHLAHDHKFPSGALYLSCRLQYARMMRYLDLLILTLLLPLSYALKFDIVAQPGHSAKNERCIRNFVNKDTLVVVTATVSGNRGDGQMVNMHVRQPRRLHLCKQQQKRNALTNRHTDQRLRRQ